MERQTLKVRLLGQLYFALSSGKDQIWEKLMTNGVHFNIIHPKQLWAINGEIFCLKISSWKASGVDCQCKNWTRKAQKEASQAISCMKGAIPEVWDQTQCVLESLGLENPWSLVASKKFQFGDISASPHYRSASLVQASTAWEKYKVSHRRLSCQSLQGRCLSSCYNYIFTLWKVDQSTGFLLLIDDKLELYFHFVKSDQSTGL